MYLIAEDRDRRGTSLAINEFDSYEGPRSSRAHPLTTEFAEMMAERTEGRSFSNLDVLDELTRP